MILAASVLAFWAIVVFLPLQAHAHGYINLIKFGDKEYVGAPLRFGSTRPVAPSIIRQMENGFPLRGANNPHLSCGLGAKLAKEVAHVMPGDVVEAWWIKHDKTSRWPHNKGPVLTYMGSCGSSNCTELDGKDVKWFKINQQGRTTDKAGGVWPAMAALHDKKPYTFTIPHNIAPGGYILRSEIIALHFAAEKYDPKKDHTGAQFYPSCIQIHVGGSGTGKPTKAELVSMPGAYKDTDPGIYVPKLYYKPPPYAFPGPPIAAFVKGSTSKKHGKRRMDAQIMRGIAKRRD